MPQVPELRAPLPVGDAGTDATVAAMTAVVHHAAESPWVRQVVFRLGLYGSGDVVRVIFGFLKNHVRFKRDPFGKELLRHPDQLLQEIEAKGFTEADCDDLAMLGAAILLAAGLRPVFVVMARQPATDYEHVYVGVCAGGGYVALDAQECERPGVEVGAWRRKVYPV